MALKPAAKFPVDTAANWTSSDSVLLAGMLGIESDTGKFKIGNGVDVWANLDYAAGEGDPVEGTAVLSTGETGGTKFLREDGDGTCSWQALSGGSGGDPDFQARVEDHNVIDGTTLTSPWTPPTDKAVIIVTGLDKNLAIDAPALTADTHGLAIRIEFRAPTANRNITVGGGSGWRIEGAGSGGMVAPNAGQLSFTIDRRGEGLSGQRWFWPGMAAIADVDGLSAALGAADPVPVTVVTENAATLTRGDTILTTATPTSATLPTTAALDIISTVSNDTGGAVTINRDGSNTITTIGGSTGQTSVVVANGATATFRYPGSGAIWYHS